MNMKHKEMNGLIAQSNNCNAMHVVIGMTLLLWFTLVVILSMRGFFVSLPGKPPLNVLIFWLSSIGIFSLAYRNFSAFRSYVLNIDMRLLIMLHSWRTLGVGFIMLYTYDQLPMLFAFPAGLGDALIAISAVFLAYALFKRESGVAKRWIWRWNTFGLIDFIAAVTLGILTRTGGPLVSSPLISSDIMTSFPLVIIPGFLVQVFTLTHIVIYLQLRNNWAKETTVKLA